MDDNELKFLKESLTNGKMSVKFTKSDGTDRVMLCTQNMEFVPEDDRPLPTAIGVKTEPHDDLMKVYDLEISEWRSFKPSRVISYSTL